MGRPLIVIALMLASACAPKPAEMICWEKATNRAVAAREAISGWKRIYVYRDDNGLEQRISPRDSHLWRCDRRVK